LYLEKFNFADGIYLDEVDSTNTYLKNPSIPNWNWVVAEIQTKGRGRRDHKWETIGDNNLFFSAKASLQTLGYSFGLIALFAAGAVIRTLETIFPEKAQNLQIKWPNDIYYKSKKAGGILIESFYEGEKNILIIGLGLNFNKNNTNNLQNSIGILDGEKNEAIKKIFLKEFIPNLNNLFYFTNENSKNELNFIDNKSFLNGKLISTMQGNILVQGRVIGLSDSGYLIIKTDTNYVELIDTSPDFEVMDA
jgi:BirA family biotin operon repressor/biotin-[acetyl-CoA-carboxylase] ligase